MEQQPTIIMASGVNFGVGNFFIHVHTPFTNAKRYYIKDDRSHHLPLLGCR